MFTINLPKDKPKMTTGRKRKVLTAEQKAIKIEKRLEKKRIADIRKRCALPTIDCIRKRCPAIHFGEDCSYIL